MDYVIQMIIILMYTYYTYQIGDIEKGRIKAYVLLLVTVSIMILTEIFGLSFVGWIINGVVFVLFDLFYDREPFKYQWYKVGIFAIAAFLIKSISVFTSYADYMLELEVMCFVSFIMLSKKRGYLNKFNGIVVGCVFLMLLSSNFLFMAYGKYIFRSLKTAYIFRMVILVFAVLLFVLLEATLKSYKSDYEISTKRFQQDVLKHQYSEIKNIYMNMRGWRHDYHNHLQVLKADMTLKDYDKVNNYLDELEKDLDSVDTYVKSGNMMIDAILNSKLSIAEKEEIKITCKAEVPEGIKVNDIDLCVILGNLLDNAIESCEKIDKEDRFLRIYIIVNKKQLYISVQNSAKEILDFNEKNYITNKRGNHGLGMKRVQSLVDKYDGFLNLQNEPGIFASEVTIPLI